MALLFEDDYELLKSSGLVIEEDEAKRFLVIKNYPVQPDLYLVGGQPITELEVLLIIPPNYNTSGGDMFWTYPRISRANGMIIPNYGGDPRIHAGKSFDRWSRHFKPGSWRPKIDNVQKILSRVEWALRNPQVTG
ncbi:E2/UBC family protein [Salinimicrobium xinjiangense]|uniref:E2/UBC family protein n=1 Tax=Salinimicrobium xinjiangense TaxID=438596 RepID=UPI00048EEC2C|nr:E2/UBC family protein [Salinimicrobium xinjiangense]